ncbi:MAG TPA: hypothetical protein VI732_00305, partial [Alphaproteobacteria bacterium]|nr:hypothetical protein [Alphaproteobacteria bacterium]
MKYGHSISGFLSSGQWSRAFGPRGLVPGVLVAGSLIAASALLAACSDVPDALNPVAWWDGVFGDDEPAQAQSVKAAPAAAAAPTAQTAQNQAAPGADQSFPTLQEVPEKPVTSTVEQRRQMMQGLASDRANAHYSDESARAAEAAPSAEAAASAAPAPSGAPSSAGASSAAGPAASSKDTGLELMPDSAASAPPVPPPSATGRKSYLSGADTGPEPAAPPAPEKSAPAPAMAEKGSAPPAKGGAVTPPAPGSSELNQVYAAKLKESAPTVSTTPVG